MSINPIPPRPLTPEEGDTLAGHETVIARHIGGFREVGAALIAIRDGKLYRAEYSTFEDYCRRRWDISPQQGLRLVTAARVVANLESEPIGSLLPATESQARPLAQLPPEQQSAAWGRAVDNAAPRQPTAAHVAEAVDYFRPPPATISFFCHDCGEQFDERVWHCTVCAHHWQTHVTVCPNCHHERTTAATLTPSPFRAAVAEAVAHDDSYRENVLMEQYHAVAQRLLAAASTGRDLVRHVAPDEIAAFLTAEDDKTFTYVADLLGWLQRVNEARRAGAQGIRRIK